MHVPVLKNNIFKLSYFLKNNYIIFKNDIRLKIDMTKAKLDPKLIHTRQNVVVYELCAKLKWNGYNKITQTKLPFSTAWLSGWSCDCLLRLFKVFVIPPNGWRPSIASTDQNIHDKKESLMWWLMYMTKKESVAKLESLPCYWTWIIILNYLNLKLYHTKS